jgi:hypothetical protein
MDQLGARRRELSSGPSSTIWTPAAGVEVTTDTLLSNASAPKSLPVDVESKLRAILTEPIRPGEGHQLGNGRKEHELRTVFASLTPVDALHLRHRLDLDHPVDKLALLFRRLVPERRRRLISFLTDPKRRAAVQSVLKQR